ALGVEVEPGVLEGHVGGVGPGQLAGQGGLARAFRARQDHPHQAAGHAFTGREARRERFHSTSPSTARPMNTAYRPVVRYRRLYTYIPTYTTSTTIHTTQFSIHLRACIHWATRLKDVVDASTKGSA